MFLFFNYQTLNTMVKVQNVGERRVVINPQDGKATEMVHVTFIEEGRGGANPSLSLSSDVLSDVLGVQAGLQQIRVHSQLVSLEAAPKLRAGDELPLFINRRLYSTPVMRQQVDVSPRMIDGRPTYFATELGKQPTEDVDLRLSNEVLVNAQGSLLFKAQVGGTEVRVIRNNRTEVLTPEDIQEEINKS